jgi:hypothetical protein
LTLGWALDLNELHWDTWGFWAILALFWASETMVRYQTIEQAREELAEIVKRMNKQIEEQAK